MKQIVFALALLIFQIPVSAATRVKLESLEDFDVKIHKISVRLYDRVKDHCLRGPGDLEKTFADELIGHGFQVAPANKSDIEFAIVTAGFVVSGPHACGVEMISRVRQIPLIKLLRVPPESRPTRYRLWEKQHLLTGHESEIQKLLEEKAREDVNDFFQHVLERTMN